MDTGSVVRVRSWTVPDRGDVSAAGLPMVSRDSIAVNAQVLWEAVLTTAQREGSPEILDGVPGWQWKGTLTSIEQIIWPALVSAPFGATDLRPATRARNALRRYLRDSGNLLAPATDWRGHGRGGTMWWIRAVWNDAVPALWTQEDDASMSRRGEVIVSWKCPDCQEPFDDGGTLTEHRAAEHPVQAPELDGASLLADTLACMGDEDRIHLQDLAILLSAGNPDVYAGVTAMALGKAFRLLGLAPRHVRVGTEGEYSYRTGVYRADVQVARDQEEDAEAGAVVAAAHVVAEKASPPRSPSAMLNEAVAAILDANDALTRKVSELTAEIEQLRRQPVSQDLIDKALASRDARIADLERRLAAARKVIGVG